VRGVSPGQPVAAAGVRQFEVPSPRWKRVRLNCACNTNRTVNGPGYVRPQYAYKVWQAVKRLEVLRWKVVWHRYGSVPEGRQVPVGGKRNQWPSGVGECSVE